MSVYHYARPGSLDEVFGLLEEHGDGARLLSGGTDLLVGLRKGKFSADVVIDLKGVAEIAPAMTEVDGHFEVAAATVMTDLVEDPRVREWYPALVEAASAVGSIQIRNRATLAGNMCNASPAADTAPPLLVYGASVEMGGRQGRRRMPLSDFLLGPGRTAREPGEVVTAISIPIPEASFGSAFARMTRRRGVDLATVSVCCGVDESGSARFALGAAGPKPFVVSDDSGVLGDPAAEEAEKERRIGELMASATPITDVRGSEAYRRAMLVVTGSRTLQRALERRGGASR